MSSVVDTPEPTVDARQDEAMLHGLPMPRRLFAVFSISAGTILLTMDSSIATVGLPTIARDLHMAESSSVLLVAIYNLVLAMTLMPLAALGVRLGLRRLFLAGLVIYCVGAAATWFAAGLPLLLVARAIQGLGAAAALSVSSALVRSAYPAHQLGRGLGLNTLAGATGAAMAPVFGGLIVSHASWHWVFVAGVPLALAALVSGRALPEPVQASERFDIVGAALCAATFGLAIYALQSIADHRTVLTTAALFAGAATTAVVFVVHAARSSNPVLPVDLLARPALGLSVAAGLCGYLSSTCVMLALPFRLHGFGFSPAEIGTVIVPYAVATTIFAPAAGMLSDRISPAILGTCGLVIATVALVFIFRLPSTATHFDVAWPMALCGAGFGMFMPPNARLIIGSAPPDRAAPASSLIGTTRMISQAAGSALVGALLASGLGPAAPLLSAGLAALGLALSAARLWVRTK
jgi:DHA2 family multidrug resistance protein-like MFS transporter